jgi:hypothetical protein
MRDSGASRREIAKLRLMNTNAPHSQLSSPANGSAEWPPDDRLRRAIQYSETSMMESRSRSVLDTPLSRSVTVIATNETTRQSRLRHSGAMRSIEPGISRFPDAQLRI